MDEPKGHTGCDDCEQYEDELAEARGQNNSQYAERVAEQWHAHLDTDHFD